MCSCHSDLSSQTQLKRVFHKIFIFVASRIVHLKRLTMDNHFKLFSNHFASIPIWNWEFCETHSIKSSLTLLDISFFVDLTYEEAQGAPPPGKCILGTFMSSNHFVTHQTHKNGQYYNLKLSKSLFKCKRDSRMNQKFQFYLNFQMTSNFFYRYCGGHYNIKIRHFELMEPPPPVK